MLFTATGQLERRGQNLHADAEGVLGALPSKMLLPVSLIAERRDTSISFISSSLTALPFLISPVSLSTTMPPRIFLSRSLLAARKTSRLSRKNPLLSGEIFPPDSLAEKKRADAGNISLFSPTIGLFSSSAAVKRYAGS